MIYSVPEVPIRKESDIGLKEMAWRLQRQYIYQSCSGDGDDKEDVDDKDNDINRFSEDAHKTPI